MREAPADEVRAQHWRGLPDDRRPDGAGKDLRVLHCIGNLGGGGAERQLNYLLRGLVQRGTSVHLAYRLGGPNLASMRDAGIHIHQLHAISNYDLRLIWEIKNLIRQIQPDLVQTWLPQMDTLAGLASLITGTPFILSERSVAAAYARKPWRWLRKRIGRRAQFVIANSNGGREYWRPEQRSVGLIRNGVPADEIEAVQQANLSELGLAGNSKLVLFAGRYSAEKNVLRLVDAICDALTSRPSAVAIFMGEGPLRDKMLTTVEFRQLQGRIKVLGYTHELWSYMKRAAVFVSVSLFEGCPNTIVEAAVQNCPLLLSDIPQHRELFGSDAARYVNPHASTQITAALIEMLDNADQCRLLATAAHETAMRLTVDYMVESYVECYCSAVAGTTGVSH